VNENTIHSTTFRSGSGATALWWGVLAGPIAFAADEVLSYAIVQHSCSTGYRLLLHFYTISAILVCISGFLSALWCYNKIPRDAGTEAASVASRSRWMAIYGFAASIAFVIVIIALAIPKWALSPCDQ
jgi:signal transduction histidine kinase